MRKQQKKNLIIGSVVLIIGIIGILFYFGNVKVAKTDDGLSIQLYDKNGVLIKDLKPFMIVDVAGQTFSNVEFIKLNYKVTNTGNIPLIISITESNPQAIWTPTSQEVQPQSSITFTTSLINLNQLINLPQPFTFSAKAVGSSTQLTIDKYPTTFDVLQATLIANVVTIVADIQGDLNMGLESCVPNADYGSEQEAVIGICSSYSSKDECEYSSGAESQGEFCIWR